MVGIYEVWIQTDAIPMVSTSSPPLFVDRQSEGCVMRSPKVGQNRADPDMSEWGKRRQRTAPAVSLPRRRK
jgi:hypothetical protein